MKNNRHPRAFQHYFSTEKTETDASEFKSIHVKSFKDFGVDKVKKTITAIISLALIAGCHSAPTPRYVHKPTYTDSLKEDYRRATIAADSGGPSVEKPVSDWYYTDLADNMDGKPVHNALVSAIDKLYFEAPYDGGSTATLIIRNKRGVTDVGVTITKGQFLGSNLSGGYVLVKFDDNKPAQYSFNDPQDLSTTVIFLNNTQKFISRLKRAKRVIIEAQFYREGVKDMVFPVKGFKWP